MHDQKKAYLYGVVAVLFWSTVASAFKISLRHMAPEQLLLYASAVSLLVLGGVLVVQGKFGLVYPGFLRYSRLLTKRAIKHNARLYAAPINVIRVIN